ncbi:MAG: hypothetical protein V3T18_04665 [Pseudomonadales bacterium]
MSFLSELMRRNVFRVAAAYIIVAWLILQIVDVVIPMLHSPEWSGSLVFLLIAVGFPLALFLAWAYELTPDGLKRTHEVPAEHSITGTTGRKIDFIIIGALVLALGVSVYLNITGEDAPAPATTASSDLPGVAVLPLDNRSARV